MILDEDGQAKLFGLINKSVKIKAAKSDYHGRLICVDPITFTCLLLDPDGNVEMIFQHSIESILPINEDDNDQKDSAFDFQKFCDEFFNFKTVSHEPSELDDRRKKVLDLLKSNNVPVEEIDKSLIAAYYVLIDPPYTSSDCKSSNAIVLTRIKNILEKNE